MKKLKEHILFEMTGLPGSGKTTLVKKLKENLSFTAKEDYINEVGKLSVMQKIIQVSGFALKQPLMLFYLMMFLLSNWKFNAKAIERALKFFLGAAYTQHLINHKKHNGILVYDQGLIQDLWALMLYTGNKNTKYLAKIITLTLKNFNVICINLEINSESAVNRIGQRAYDGCEFDNMDRNRVQNLFSSKRANFDLLLELVGKEKVHHIKGNDDVEINCKQSRNIIENEMKVKGR